MAEPGDIVITGMGMRCGVGNHATQSCASVRAGINRFAGWKYFGGDEESAPLTASAVAPDLGDDAWINKAGMLLDDPLSEMLWEADLLDTRGMRLGAFLALPDARREGTDAAQLGRFLGNIQQELRFPTGMLSAVTIAGDQAGGAQALRQAVEAMQQNKLDVAIVAGVDSLLHGPYLSWLHDQGRLKFADASWGCIPGEAGACVTIETRAHAERRGAKPLARIAALAVESEGAPLNLTAPCKGKALTLAILQVLPVANNGADVHQIYTDLNGERWRFLEWAIVTTRFAQTLPHDWDLHHPADCIGDIGAAWIPGALALVTHAYQRRSAGPGNIMITAASDAGSRAALMIGPA